jgi:hypothetical protein
MISQEENSKEGRKEGRNAAAGLLPCRDPVDGDFRIEHATSGTPLKVHTDFVHLLDIGRIALSLYELLPITRSWLGSLHANAYAPGACSGFAQTTASPTPRDHILTFETERI